MTAIQRAVVDDLGNIQVHGREGIVVLLKIETATAGVYENIADADLFIEVSGKYRVALAAGANVYTRQVVLTRAQVAQLATQQPVPFVVVDETPTSPRSLWAGLITSYGFRVAPTGAAVEEGVATSYAGASVIVQPDADTPTVVVRYDGPTGPQGLSAYDVAVADGFSGDETAWLASLGGIVPWGQPAAWVTATAYSNAAPRSVVTINGSSYVCAVSHTSGVFATDLAAAKWLLIASKGDTGATGEAGWTAFTTLTYGATITPNLATSRAFRIAATGDFTLATPSNATNGMVFQIEITQDATGGRVITFDDDYHFEGRIPPVLSAAGNTVDVLTCVVLDTGRLFGALARNVGRNS